MFKISDPWYVLQQTFCNAAIEPTPFRVGDLAELVVECLLQAQATTPSEDWVLNRPLGLYIGDLVTFAKMSLTQQM